MPCSEKELARKKAYYHKNREVLLAKNKERRIRFYHQNQEVEKAKSLARYYFKKGELETAKGVLEGVGVEFPASWLPVPAP
jgi:hypothetical protein